MKRYEDLACMAGVLKRCKYITDWRKRHEKRLDFLMSTSPGCGTDLDGTTSEKRLVFNITYYHTNGSLTHHQVIATPSLINGCDLRITGRDKNEIKNSLLEMFYSWLNEEV